MLVDQRHPELSVLNVFLGVLWLLGGNKCVLSK